MLAERFPLLAATEPEVVAYHYTEAGLSGHAIPYWQQAGQRAVERSANVEAIEHLTTGLQLLKTRPDPQECTHQELTLLTTLGPALMATKGYASPEAEQTYARARELGQQMERTPQLFAVFYGLWAFYLVRAEFPIAQELAEQLLTLAQRVQDSALLVVAHQAMGTMTVSLGDEALACTHLERALAFHDPQQHRALAFIYGQDPAVFCLAFTAWAQWLLGHPAQALAKNHEAVSRANELDHSFSLASVLVWAAIFHSLRRDVQATYEQAETAITLSTELGFPFRVAEGTILRGWALAILGKAEEGIAQIHQGLAMHQATGAKIARPWWLALLAEAYGKTGQPEEGLITLAEALELVHKTGENQWEAELHRLQGELLLARSTVHHTEAEVERCFSRALDMACRQQAKSLELRAATSLARLWQQQGKRQDAYDLLAPVYDWFTEGFDTADLQEAKRVLGDLS